MTGEELTGCLKECWEKNTEELPALARDNIYTYGRQRGWLEDGDERLCRQPINRMNTARILHQFLKTECHETDEENWNGAEKLLDLYDCHACVNHVAQMYAKGIMEAENLIFGMQRMLEPMDAKTYIERLWHPEKRLPIQPVESAKKQNEGIGLSCKEALKLYNTRPGMLLVDLRSREKWQEDGIKGARNLSFTQLLENPGMLEKEFERGILLYCEAGVQSRMLAACLTENGCRNCYYFGLKNNE